MPRAMHEATGALTALRGALYRGGLGAEGSTPAVSGEASGGGGGAAGDAESVGSCGKSLLPLLRLQVFSSEFSSIVHD